MPLFEAKRYASHVCTCLYYPSTTTVDFISTSKGKENGRSVKNSRGRTEFSNLLVMTEHLIIKKKIIHNCTWNLKEYFYSERVSCTLIINVRTPNLKKDTLSNSKLPTGISVKRPKNARGNNITVSLVEKYWDRVWRGHQTNESSSVQRHGHSRVGREVAIWRRHAAILKLLLPDGSFPRASFERSLSFLALFYELWKSTIIHVYTTYFISRRRTTPSPSSETFLPFHRKFVVGWLRQTSWGQCIRQS